ncbi:hypothetical protein [Acrocarpospora catenulata]|uniref:hypothetical protein n=1 Tax=Acrocarpospora catenulata TaxID=2836182 RepID=UPI001BD9DA60|nr:hypothetical protein [Acrocarpospora catenulata]
MTDVGSLREQLRRERFMYLVRLAFELEGRGVSCTLRLPGRRGEYAVLEMPGGSSGVVRVGVRRERAGWLYTVGAYALGVSTVAVTVGVQSADPAGMVLRAVSR